MGDPVEVDHEHLWADQRAAFDAMLASGAVARVDGAWMILSHDAVVAAATDPASFSSRVTDRRVIPNGLDGAEHARFREVGDRYLTAERVALVEPRCRQIAQDIVDALPRGVTVRTIAGIGVPFAVRSQSAWLGWPPELEAELVAWMAENHAATRSADRSRTAEAAAAFDRVIHALLDARRDGPASDVTGELMRDTVGGRPLTDAEIVSILRNWTAGDLGSLATSVGVIVHLLASSPDVQRELRTLVAGGDTAGVEAAVHELLRIDDPFVSNRRVTTCDVDVAGVGVRSGARVLLNWTAANRDPEVFGDPDRYDPLGNAAKNLVFGIGPHACPGKALTLMELRVLTEELLGRTRWLELSDERPAVRETPSVGGWSRVPVVLR